MNVIFDACSLLNLRNGGVLPTVLATIHGRLGPLVYDETKSIRDEVDALVASGALEILDDSTLPASAFYKLVQAYSLGPGETECMTFAKHLSGDPIVCSDDRRARNACKEELGADKVTGTLGLLARSVAIGKMTEADALGAYSKMKLAGAFLPAITSEQFRALVRPKTGKPAHH